jgi:hypothetical protein
MRVVAAAAGMAVLAGCGAQDSQSPSSDPGLVSLVPGQSAPVAGATTLRIQGGGAGSENVLVLVDTATVGVSAKTTYTVAATGVGAAGAVSTPASSLSPDPNTLFAPKLDIGFGARLNEASRARLRRGFGAARSMMTARTASPVGRSNSLASGVPNVGDLVNVNVGSDACDTLVPGVARVVAISTRAIVLADTLNPSGGFSTADYQRFAVRFDTLV